MHRATYNLLRLPGDQAVSTLAPARPDLSDEELAGRSAARLLITANSGAEVETLARRIHAAGRAATPFVQASARELCRDIPALRTMCGSLLERARGGSLLVTDVEEMPDVVQENVLDVLDDLQGVRGSSPGVRLMSGTTVPLLSHVRAGTFSERLYYRLNLLHVKVPGASARFQASPREMMGYAT